MTVRVGVNLLWCRPGKVGGSEQYLSRQLAGLAMVNDGNVAVTAFAPRGFASAHPELTAVSNSLSITESGSDCANRAGRIVRESTWLAGRTRDMQIVHHGGGTVPFRTNGATMLTVHDVQYLTYPQYFSQTRLRYLAYMMPRSLRRADMIVVPSPYVRDTLVERFAINPENVRVVVHGIESVDVSTIDETPVRERFGLAGVPYFIYPAITHPHKNHRFLVELLAGPWVRRDEHLLFIGGAGRADDELKALIAARDVSGRVHFTGHVGAADRDALIRGARAVLFPSEYEGFGAPVAEAMTLGVPVVTSDRASLPGVVGSGGIVLPLSIDAWADIPERVAGQRDLLVAAGAERALAFTLESSGRDLLAAYLSLAARGVAKR